MYCDKKCIYLLPELRACCHPSFSGKGKHLECRGKQFVSLSGCGKDFFPEKKQAQNKYRAKKVIVDGVTYDSQIEYARFLDLYLLQKVGEIRDLKHHVPYQLIPASKCGKKIVYIADFVYYSVADKCTVTEDVKSKATKTALYRLKKRLMAEQYGIKIKEVFYSA